MIELVLDASVLIKWFKTDDEQYLPQARALRTQFERGELALVVPPLLFLELLNIASRRWGWDAARLEHWAGVLECLGFEVAQPRTRVIARWCGRGLTAYDACYLALAEERRTAVVTADEEMISIGARFVHALGAVQA